MVDRSGVTVLNRHRPRRMRLAFTPLERSQTTLGPDRIIAAAHLSPAESTSLATQSGDRALDIHKDPTSAAPLVIGTSWLGQAQKHSRRGPAASTRCGPIVFPVPERVYRALV
jgi:hypothetical protein